jgi:hypothetical protein
MLSQLHDLPFIMIILFEFMKVSYNKIWTLKTQQKGRLKRKCDAYSHRCTSHTPDSTTSSLKTNLKDTS